MSIDALLAAEIVTADGEIRQVDAEHEPDLFWAIRGGGGNFGVITKFQFELEEVPSIVGGMLLLPATPETIAGLHRGGGGGSRGAVDDRQRHAGAADAVPGRGASRQARRSWR